MADTIQKLEAIVQEIRDLDDARAAKMRERDTLIHKAREEGATWTALQEVTGLTVGAFAKALKRASPP